jgi:ribonuclease P protein component
VSVYLPDLASPQKRTTVEVAKSKVVGEAGCQSPSHIKTHTRCRAVLKPEHRLRRSEEFASTMRRGKRAARSRVVVHVDAARRARHEVGEDEREAPRIGFVVSRSVGGAVVRNRVRRRLRHLMADRLAEVPAGACVVVRARPGAATSTNSALARDLDGAISAAIARFEERR